MAFDCLNQSSQSDHGVGSRWVGFIHLSEVWKVTGPSFDLEKCAVVPIFGSGQVAFSGVLEVGSRYRFNRICPFAKASPWKLENPGEGNVDPSQTVLEAYKV